jgi:hypothetical protein
VAAVRFNPVPFGPRVIKPEGVLRRHGWALKVYGVTLEGQTPSPAAFDRIIPIAFAALPQPPITAARAGVGFLICHHGSGMDFCVLAWWERENELFTRVWTRPHVTGRWTRARGGETACVWDLLIFTRERDAYVDAVLAPGGPDVAAYLERMWDGQV